MKRKVVLLVALTIVFSTVLGLVGFDSKNVIAADAIQKVNFTSAVVTGDAVNVREGASTKFPVVCVLKKGQTVRVIGKLGEWYAVYEPKKGCVGAVSGAYVKPLGATGQAPAAPKLAAKTPPKTVVPTAAPSGITKDEQVLLDLVNKARRDAGAGALSFDMNLMKVAKIKAKDMVDNNYFSHQSPTYGSPFDMMRQFGVSFRTAGENIAGNQTVEGAFKAWMNSEGHKKNILNGNFNYVGFGIVESPTYGKMLVQMFIGR
ncbi:MAG: CAP domain-containing protein [Clostridia bacterium]|nr:CAP domain-containing protein [Clostridia bacterium]